MIDISNTQMSFTIQYISDIHLETHHNTSKSIFEKILKPSSPYLALCGDIGYPGAQLYEPFLKYCSDNFKYVFYIAGNHEFYNDMKSIKFLKMKNRIINELNDEDLTSRLSIKFSRDTREIRIQKIKEICQKFPNIHFLDKEIFKIPNTNIIIVGCTLWTKLDMNPFMLPQFNDFHRICEDKDTLLTPKTYDDWNKEDVEYLEKVIPENPESKIIVLTHHCPTYDIIIEKYKYDPHNMNSFFANTDLITPFGKNVKAWICGHTHGCNKITVDNTIVATNTFGYEWEIIDGFKNDAVIEI
jgi:predicted MPP superfamily phosphohydrolase